MQMIRYSVSSECDRSVLMAIKQRMNKKEEQEFEWWKKHAIYQIYPRSFKDSTGSSTGDLQGILEKLDYLEWLGVKIVWLSPINKSPMKDFGYDISDYRDIDPIFGTMADLKELIAEMHRREMYFIMDFVPNHTSDQHVWFEKSRNRQEPFSDYYVWKNGRKSNLEHKQWDPPNNWQSVFGGPAWTWCPKRKQFYLHQFLAEQPDLNFRNPSVRKEMREILEFWMDLGVDGFRVDATSHLIEHADFPDNVYPKPKVETTTDDKAADQEGSNYYSEESSSYYEEEPADDDTVVRFNVDQPETYDLISEWVKCIRSYGKKHKKHILFMTESYCSTEEIKKYYRTGIDFPFNFTLCCNWRQHSSTGSNLKQWVNNWMTSLRPSDWPNWVLSNHDQPRLASKLGSPDFVDIAHMLLLLLPGTATCYQGDELGISNVKVSSLYINTRSACFYKWNDVQVTFDQCQDPFGKRFGPDLYEKNSRDPSRSPMPWSPRMPNAGFTSNKDGPWLPLNEDWKERNVESQKEDEKSHLNFFRKLLNLRQTDPVLQLGNNLRFLDSGSEKILAFERVSPDSEERLLVVMNVDFESEDSPVRVNFSEKLGTIVLRTENFSKGLYEVNSQVKLGFRLNVGQGLVVRFEGDLELAEPQKKRRKLCDV